MPAPVAVIGCLAAIRLFWALADRWRARHPYRH